MNEENELFPKLNLPPTRLSMKCCADGVMRVYDPLRRKYVALTPEEWVRQHFVAHMVGALGFPETLLANEVAITLNGTSRRCDTVVYSRQGLKPLAIVEYKAPHVVITQRVFDQISRYNMVLRVLGCLSATAWGIIAAGLIMMRADVCFSKSCLVMGRWREVVIFKS